MPVHSWENIAAVGDDVAQLVDIAALAAAAAVALYARSKVRGSVNSVKNLYGS